MKQSGWCQPVYEKALMAGLPERRTYRMPYKDILRNELCFVLKEQNLEWLKSSEPEEKHEGLMINFFSEVINNVGQFLW